MITIPGKEGFITDGDASGGELTSVPELRRCGCGLAKLNPDFTLSFGCNFNLPGEIQTVPRAEIFALVVLVRHMHEGADVHYITDNEGLYKAFNAGPVVAYKTNNCDLYAEIFESTVKKAIRLSVRWIPSHLDVEKPFPQMSP